ncbi:uncharacterized protein C8orf88 homolog isoform X3 [Protopterus annectens]|uniref:uncharacterized protein C8orf88 homolog isoform X3 n=1 Tax=Protopterus annectens TaxID=7888 RepID=UPI001CFB893E|nr:uncharacterized protein C8orf88 homolog isoform X3 [Protopterus annectens]
MIEAKKLIGKSLQPARPLRRSLLHCESKIWEDCQKDFSQNEMYWQDHDSLWCRVNGIQNEHVTVANKEKRITKTTEVVTQGNLATRGGVVICDNPIGLNEQEEDFESWLLAPCFSFNSRLQGQSLKSQLTFLKKELNTVQSF